MMKELIVNMVCAAGITAQGVPALLDKENIPFETISTVDWPNQFPYKPKVEFRVAYTDSAVLVHYKVTENDVAAVAGRDNGRVWEDACVEFFSSPNEADGIYYNFECNCVGRLLIEAGVPGHRAFAPQEVIDGVDRWCSLGRQDFEARSGECSWEMAMVIPFKTWYLHDIKSLKGKTIRANFYKCGDHLKTPHYLSWSPIDLPAPKFHCPEFFGKVTFK